MRRNGRLADARPAPPPGHVPGAVRILRLLASRHWMLAFFVFAAASALVSVERPDWITAAWALPLTLFAVSLLAAVATSPRFRRDAALLGLHFGLLAFILLVLLSRLTYLDGAVTLTQGDAFDGRLQFEQRGPLHPGGVERLRFTNEGVIEDFNRQARWQATSNRVRWWDVSGQERIAEIGDDRPLVLGSYRVYTTQNRGYSPVFRWEPRQGAEEVGTVQLRAGEEDMANDWELPGGLRIWAMLAPSASARLQRGQQRPNLGAANLAHELVIRAANRRETLRPGGSIDFEQGRLTYVRLDSWMGYRIVYDVAMHWMAAAAAVVVACMMAFYARIVWRGGARKEKGEEACS